MKNIIITAIAIVIIAIAFIFLKKTDKAPSDLAIESKTYERIISLSPSTTEILYALELEDRLIAVTDFCKYPAEAKMKTSVGGYLNPNYEVIVSLKPDLVIILPEQENVRNFLAELNIESLVINNKTVQQILDGIKTIGEKCGKQKFASKMLHDIQARMEKIQQKTAGLERPGVLISIGRALGENTLTDLYAAGANTYYSEIIKLAGGTNTLENSKVDYPLLSVESIIQLNPDIIIDLVFGFAGEGMLPNEIKKDWLITPDVNAVKNNRLYVINKSYTVIPGPRFIILLEKLAEIMHPEINWDLK